MPDELRTFWEDVRDFARARRCGRRVSLDVATAALNLEKEMENRLNGEQGLRLAAARRDPAVTARDPFADESKAQG